MPPKPRLSLVQESGRLRVDKEETAERGGGRPLPMGLPDAVGGGDGGWDAPPHTVAVPKGDIFLNILLCTFNDIIVAPT